MLLTDGMVTQDNDPTTFFPIAAATARLLTQVNAKKNERTGGKTDAGRREQNKSSRNGRDVDNRLNKRIALRI